MHPDDDHDGIFEDLSPESFGPISEMMFPTEIINFDEFVIARLQMIPPAFAAAPKHSLTHAALSNGQMVCQFVPSADEKTGEFFARLTRQARSMRAHSFFYCRITEAPGLDTGSGWCVLWVAHCIAGDKPVLRCGVIPIDSHNELGEICETPVDDGLGPFGEAFIRVLLR